MAKRKRDDWVELAHQRVADADEDRAQWRQWCEEFEQMMRLQAFEQTAEFAHEEGKEQFSIPTPYNVVHLSRRLLAGPMEVQVVPVDDTESAREQAESLEAWLTGFWHRMERESRRNLKDDLVWWGAVRGRMVLDVRWVGDHMPEEMQSRRLPFVVRTLDPLNVYCGYGEYGVDWGVHHYEPTVAEFRARWPKAKLKDADDDPLRDADTVEVYDYWERYDGKIWNCVIANREVVKEAKAVDYPRVPFVEGFCDPTPLADEEMRGLPLLFGLKDIWPYQNRLLSQLATGMLWYFWPAILVHEDVPGAAAGMQVKVGPGMDIPVPPGIKSIQPLQIDPNVKLADELLQLVRNAVDEATYPSVMYGQSPGASASGYAINLLGSAAKGRVSLLQQPLELLLAEASELVIDLVHEFSTEPVDVFQEAEDRKIQRLSLKPEDLPDEVMVFVRIAPDIPQDDMQRRMLGLREMEQQAISRQTYREEYAQLARPQREEKRVLTEIAMMDETVTKQMAAEAYQQHYGRAMPTPAYAGAEQPPPGMPPGMIPPGMPPQGPPMPPPGMMPPGMMPPGAAPGMGPGMMPPGMPPGVMPPGPMMGIPPQVMPPQMGPGPMPPPGMDPVLWAMLQGQPPPLMPPMGPVPASERGPGGP